MSIYNILNISLIKESFHSNKAAEFQLEPEQTNDGIKFEIQTRHIKDNIHEVSMNLVVGAKKTDGSVLYEAQSTNAGLFEIAGFNQEEFDKVIKVHCATALYPYCRARISQLVAASPFNIGMLPTINFAKMHEENEFQNSNESDSNAEKETETSNETSDNN